MPSIEHSGRLMLERCSQCNEVGGPLLACDEDLNHLPMYKGVKPRYVAIVGKIIESS